MKLSLACAFACLLLASAGAAEYVRVGDTTFRSALPVNDAAVHVDAFLMRTAPVTLSEYADFLTTHPEWGRTQVPRVLADPRYLASWQGGAAHQPGEPVTEVSWHAARAFCEAEGGRLPMWYEWEWAAAADATRKDAREDAAWRARILQWYAKPTRGPDCELGVANIWGVRNLHGQLYEWVEDFNGLFITTDSRSQGVQKTLETCGAGALSLDDRENYAILMRIAMLAALKASDALPSLGFRCVKDLKGNQP
ncbi:formylglycine-generating enzyme family protein [Burkholderiaceae bacterium DAT-1]|nr:formylglycine-generating enzyme family protein [Burkholderiaceae bacterium DAT-1]